MNNNIKLAQLKASRERAISLKNIFRGAVLVSIVLCLLNSVSLFIVLGTLLMAFFTCPRIIEYKFGALNGFLKGVLASIIITLAEILIWKQPPFSMVNFVLYLSIIIGFIGSIGGLIAVFFYKRGLIHQDYGRQ
jgi:hypothetical protein